MQKNSSRPTSFLQTDLWGSFRESLGWHAHKAENILILERTLPLGTSFLYSPEVNQKPEVLLKLLPEILAIAKRRKSVFYRLELNIAKNDPLAEQWLAAFTYTGFLKSFESVQPDDRQIVSLTGDDALILSNMKPKGRYNIRVAEKADVRVRETSAKTLEEDVAIFYTLFQDTAKRDKFSIRPKYYFENLASMLYTHNAGRLFIASHNNHPLAACIITLHDGIASYLYGASSSQNRSVMAPYLMHWEVMQWARSLGATQYDLLAIKPETEKKHPYDGITRFKQQFGGESVHLLGSWDLAIDPLWYNLFKTVEKLRRH